MKQSHKIIKVVEARYTGGFSLNIKFSDGKVHKVDFEPFLKKSLHPEIRKYLNREEFSHYTIRDGELMWGDFDLIFPVDDLYKNTI
jgi:hypothetical protein